MWERVVDNWQGEPKEDWEDDEDDSDALVTVFVTPREDSRAEHEKKVPRDAPESRLNEERDKRLVGRRARVW
jgi:hypothetical protein